MPTVERGTRVRCVKFMPEYDIYPGAEGFVESVRDGRAEISWYQMNPVGQAQVFISWHRYNPLPLSLVIEFRPAEKRP